MYKRQIMEGLVWGSLLALIIRRYIAIKSLPSVSVYKAGKNVDVWLLPILEAYIHQAWSEITARLEWAQGESMSVHFSLTAVIPAKMTCSR